MTREPRGQRNKNPGNLRDFGIAWKGLAGADADGFCRFVDAEHGIRALAMDLLNDWSRDGKRTVGALIGEFAPPSENNTGAYVNAVSAALGVTSADPIDLNDHGVLKTMVRAIIKHENGVQPYDDTTLVRALTLAGVPPKPEPATRTLTVRAALATAASISPAAVVTGWQAVEPVARGGLAEIGRVWPEAAAFGLALVGFVAVAVIVYARVAEARKLVRPVAAKA